MRAVRYGEYGGTETLRVDEVRVPEHAPGQVLVRVHATGLNPKDAMIRSGALRLQTGRTFPRGTGFDFAGEVAVPGAGVDDLRPGARVWGFLDGVLGGAAADFVAVPRAWVSEPPGGMGWLEAASLPLVASTALQALRDVAGVKSGDPVLVRGASGGVGAAAIQIARAMGARVTALTRSEGVAQCRALGADEVVDAAGSDWAAGGRRFRVVIECVGGSGVTAARKPLAPGGRWVAVAPDLAVFALAPLTRHLPRRVPGPRFDYVVVRPRAADLRDLAGLASEGRLGMPVGAVYPLERIREAHAAMAVRIRGKRVIAVSGEAIAEAESLPPVAFSEVRREARASA